MKYQKVTRESPTGNPLDRRFTFTRFPDPLARTKREPRMSLRSWAERIPDRVADSKAALPLVKLATFGDEPTRKGSLRHNANMIAIEGVEGDYDGERMSVAVAAAKLDEAGIAAVIYTSPSHQPDKPRWRVMCPTSRSLPPAERQTLIARVNGALGGVLSGESFTLSQTFFYGAVEGQPLPRVEIIEGKAIDLAHGLDAGALDKHGKPYGRHIDEPEDDDDLRHEPDGDRIAKALAHIPADERETWLTAGQAIHHEYGGHAEGYRLWDEWSQSSDKYDSDDQERVWESFGSHVGRKVKIGTIYRLAKLHRPKREYGGLIFETPADCANAPAQPYVMKGMIAEGDVGCIFGAPGAGKSLIGPLIAYRVANGETAFGMRTKQGTTFYVAAEDATGLRQRVRALHNRHGDAPSMRVVRNLSDLYSDDSDDLEQLLAAVEAEQPKLIVIDTVAIAFPGLEENDAASMGRVIAVGRQLAEHGAAVVFIHHGTKADGSTPRGHSLFNGALDFSMQVEKGDDGIVRGRLRKNRRGTTERDIAFRIGVEELGEDEDGDPITAAVAEELTANEAARPKKIPASQRALLDILEGLEAEGTVTNEQWMEVASEGFHVSQSEDLKSRQRTCRRARADLAKLGLIKIYQRGTVRTMRHWEDDSCDI